jgi:hypothetical protein
MFDRDKDHAMLVEWCEAHGADATPRNLLPPLGVVVQRDGEDSAALFLYFALSCPVAFLDCAVTRPKLALKDAMQCFDFAITYLKAEAKENGYAVILCTAPKAVSRMLERSGFNRAEEGLARTFALCQD